MHIPAVTLCILLLPPIIFCQDHATLPAPQNKAATVADSRVTKDSVSATVNRAPLTALPKTFALPGGVSLEIKTDEMTDRRVCTLFTPLWGIYAAFDGDSVVLWTSDAIDVDYNRPALLRIANQSPVDLKVPPRPHIMLVPPRLTAELLAALYSRERVRVRFTKWPSGDADDVEMEIGDFAAGYDLGVELCGWRKTSLPRVAFSPEPVINRSPAGNVDADFGGRNGWSVYFYPPHSCSVSARAAAFELVNVRERSEMVRILGPVRFYTARGKLVATIEPNADSQAASGALLAAAYAAGEDGMVESFSHQHSLFGFRDAVKFVEQSCGVHWH